MQRQKNNKKENSQIEQWRKSLKEQRQEASEKLAKLKKKGFVSAFDYLLENGYEFATD